MRNIVLYSFLLTSFILPLSARTWTDTRGRTVEAELIEIKEKAIVLKVGKSGRTVTLALSKLSAGDQKFIEEQREKAAQKKDTETTPEEGKTEKPQSAPANWDAPWPQSSSAPDDIAITVAESDPEKKRFVYHSPNYEFVCDVKLSKSVVKNFSKLFEATHQAMVDIPFNFQKARGRVANDRLQIFLFETEESYFENGGPPGSAGVFMGGKNIIMVPLTSLGVRSLGSGYTLDRKVANKTLPHELTHQLTDRIYYGSGSRGWFTEGLAEYVAVSPYNSGRISFKSNLDEIRDYATEYDSKAQTGRALGKKITMPDLKAYMLQPYSSFAGERANFNYAFGLILTTYFIHMDDNGSRKNITAFLKAMREEVEGEELLDTLLAGRSWDELKKDISKAWKSKGIKITFE